MALIEWQENYSVGIQEFDEQHKSLIDIINTLHDSQKQNREWQTLAVILRSLMAYAANHFAVEEKLMVQYGYPDFDRHRLAHNEFVRTITNFQEDFQEARAVLPDELMHFLSEWLVGHILVVDKQYSLFFNEKGCR